MPDSFKITRGVTARKKGEWWHMRFHDSTRHPKRKEVALDTTEYAVAYQRAEEKYERYRRGEYDPWHHRDRDLTLQEFIETYEEERKGVVTEHTIATSISPVRLLQEELGEEASIRSVTPHDIQRIVYQDDLSQGAKLSYYRKLHAVFNWAHDLLYVLSNPVKKVDRPKEPKTLPKYFTEAQVDKLLKAVETVYETNQKYIHEDYVHPLASGRVRACGLYRPSTSGAAPPKLGRYSVAPAN